MGEKQNVCSSCRTRLSSILTSFARMPGGMRSGAISMTHPPRLAAYARTTGSRDAQPPCAASASLTQSVAAFRSPAPL
eukprot:31060-Pelagococcus_subviridis.AAC.7